MTAAMKFIARGNRSPPLTPPSLQSPSLETPSPPAIVRIRTTFPKTLYLYRSRKTHVSAWKTLNPEYNIQVYDTATAEAFLIREFGELHSNIFRFIRDEDIKSKFIGVCLLYIYGGFYSDADNEPVASMDTFIESDIDFVTCSSYLSAKNSFWDNTNYAFNPSFIASYKKNPILTNCIEWYVCHFEKKIPYSFLEWNMMKVFTDILQLENYSVLDNGIYHSDSTKIQILSERFDTMSLDVKCEYGGKCVIKHTFIKG